MKELCEIYRPHLPLFAESELKDAYLAERIRAHVMCCADCQGWLEEYEDLTAAILESEASAARRSDLGGDRVAPWDAPPAATSDGFGLSTSDPTKVERILVAVHREAARRRAARFRAWFGAAAMVALAVGLAAHELFLGSPRSADAPGGAEVIARDTRQAATAVDDPRVSTGATEWIEWVPDSRSLARLEERREPRDVTLIGVVRGALPAATPQPRWVFDARAEEMFRDPLGGGWTFLVDARESPAMSTTTLSTPSTTALSTTALSTTEGRRPIPVRRLRLRRLASFDDIRPAPRGESRSYRIVVVPDPATPSRVIQPAISADDVYGGSFDPGGILSGFTDSLGADSLEPIGSLERVRY